MNSCIKSSMWIVVLMTFNTAFAGDLYSKAGWVAELPLGFHDVQGKATLIDDRTIHIEDFHYDGGGPAVYFYLGLKDTTSSFINGLGLMPLLTGTPFSGGSITVTLPAGETLDLYGAISVWCEDFNVSFSSASFEPPAEPQYPRAGWVAQITGGLHQVEATATIVNDRIIHVEGFSYDGNAPAAYFYLGGNNTQEAFVTGLGLEPYLNRTYSNESLVLTLPNGRSLDQHTAISVWCVDFAVNFGSAQFKLDDPADADDDGDVDQADYASLEDCLFGPGVTPAPSMGTVQSCLDSFDRDEDGDVDVADYARFQKAFTGPPSDTAEYELVFDATWSAATHPADFPSNPHFSGLVGGTHHSGADFWQAGSLASLGIERMAETGSKTELIAEINSEIVAGNAGEVISGGGISPSPGSRSVTFVATQEFPLATVTTMIAPSPDWFVGIDGYKLFRDNQWTPEIVLEVGPWDAGTDSGVTYTSANQDTVPREPIHKIIGYPFQDGSVQRPLGTFTLRRID